MIKQRILYVGIGGSGLDIGRELTEALTHEICGLDGRRLVARGGPFAGFGRSQLPKFVQSVYFDFSQDALDEINRSLKGKNATAVHTILPPFNSFRDAASYLKNQNVPGVTEWIPDDPDVNVAPLSGGAGQYPTVGRTALFASMKRQGYPQSIGNDLGRAMDQLAQSMGELISFTGSEQYTNHIAVYVGFSLSGGTGCGIFYDVIHLLHNELVTKFPDVPCLIMPIVIMPSLFDSVLTGVNKRNTKLNAATALLDLSRLMDLFNNPDRDLATKRMVTYPWAAVGGDGGFKTINLDSQFAKTAVKVATLVERRGGLDRRDVYRSIASAIVAQVSTVASVDQAVMSFVAKLVNDNDIPLMHHTLLGRRNIMPAVSASLTIPAERLVEVVSQRIVADGLAAHFAAEPNRTPTEDHVARFLEGSGQGPLVQPRMFSEQVPVPFTVVPAALADASKYEVFQNNLQRKVVDSVAAVLPLVRQAIPDMTEIRLLDGLTTVLDSNPDRTLVDALSIANRSLSALKGEWFQEDSGSTPRRKPRQTRVFGLMKGKPQKAEADRWVRDTQDRYTNQVRALWQQEWTTRKNLWRAKVDDAERQGAQIRQWLRDQLAAADRLQADEVVRLQRTTLGVVEYLPSSTGNMQQTLLTLVNDVKAKIRERLQITESDDAALLSTVMRANQHNAWADAIRAYAKDQDGTQFIDQLIEPVRLAVQDVLEDVLTPLGESLQRLTHSTTGNRSADLDQLHGKLAGLLPDGVIPQLKGANPRILLTYPGRKDHDVEQFLKNLIFQTRYADAEMSGDEVFTFVAAGDTSSLTATINIVGQGLLDSEEVRDLLATWIGANGSDKGVLPTDRLPYRQRVGFRNLRDITDVPNRRVILRNFLAVLYDGHVSITKGTLERPEEIRVQKEATPAAFTLSLRSMYGLSPWSSLFNAWEERIVTSDALIDPGVPDAVEWFGRYVPKCLALGEAPIAPHALFEEVVAEVLRHRHATEEQADMRGLNNEARQHREAIIRFWREDILEGLVAPYSNVPNAAFTCIGAPYIRSGASKEMAQLIEERLPVA
jgi:hypothetical protein